MYPMSVPVLPLHVQRRKQVVKQAPQSFMTQQILPHPGAPQQIHHQDDSYDDAHQQQMTKTSLLESSMLRLQTWIVDTRKSSTGHNETAVAAYHHHPQHHHDGNCLSRDLGGRPEWSSHGGRQHECFASCLMPGRKRVGEHEDDDNRVSPASLCHSYFSSSNSKKKKDQDGAAAVSAKEQRKMKIHDWYHPHYGKGM
jgi:hypothetical protein